MKCKTENTEKGKAEDRKKRATKSAENRNSGDVSSGSSDNFRKYLSFASSQ